MATSNSAPLERTLDSMGIETGQPAPKATVDRKYAPFVGGNSEPFEYLRDALRRETRLRVRPPGKWRPERQTTTERSWSDGRTGHVVRLTTPSVCGDWTLYHNGDVVLADASRREAFERAAECMATISGRAPVRE